MRLSSLFLVLILYSISIVHAVQMNSIDLNKRLNGKDFKGILLDIRTPFEWKETGVIEGAVTQNAYGNHFKSYIKKLNKSKTYYIYCHSGGRSAKALRLMNNNGIKGVDITDGITGWLKNKLPTVKYIESSEVKKIIEKD